MISWRLFGNVKVGPRAHQLNDETRRVSTKKDEMKKRVMHDGRLKNLDVCVFKWVGVWWMFGQMNKKKSDRWKKER